MKYMKTIKLAVLRCAIGAALIGLGAVVSTQAGSLPQKPHVIFVQRDRVVTFDLTAPTVDQPLGGGIGAQVGTATGVINGTTALNFKYTFTSNPFVRPLTFTFDNRVVSPTQTATRSFSKTSARDSSLRRYAIPPWVVILETRLFRFSGMVGR